MPLRHFHVTGAPVPDTAAVVPGPQVRFTVLTGRLIRIEYSPDEVFEDRPSQIFWYRRQALANFQVRQSDVQTEIETDYLLLRYDHTVGGFTPNSLTIHVKETGITWSFADHIWKSENLKGTIRTLDHTNGPVELAPGLMARNGWAVVDDSNRLIFDEHGWLTPRMRPENLDLYFFGYGHDYRACLQDFQKIAGPTPLIPRWALGNWWSRYWPYTQAELQDLMEAFERHQVPLAVCIIDMDWHITDTGNPSVGWTGYTWNENLFPDRVAFINSLHAKGLKLALNLHPADGVFPHECQYREMAEAVGGDPTSPDPIGFDISDPTFVDAYFSLLHHPHEAEGIDFWWLDWQQGTTSRIKELDPLWWLNHLHFYDSGRNESKRPFIFSRWGGLGNHRYPIGFSGDTVVSWESLAFQPYFTATAANVGYGWWSHDIGGHMWGVEEGELYLRWVQWGVFSPVLRLHSSFNPYAERRPWGWGQEIERPACEALRLRHALIPYLYTMAFRNAQTGIPLILPLYYTHPEADEAYICPQQYWFGTELLAAPFTSRRVPELGLSRQSIWLPAGQWFNFFTGEYYSQGWHTIYGDLDDIPVFAKAGAIVPLNGSLAWEGAPNPEVLSIHIFAGADNRFTLYEDDGETRRYQHGSYCVTTFEQQWQGTAMTFTIAPVKGDLASIPQCRRYTLVIHGISFPDRITLTCNGQRVDANANFDADKETLTITIAAVRATDRVTLTLNSQSAALMSRCDRRAEKIRRMLRYFTLDSRIKLQIDQDLPRLLQGEFSLSRYALSEAQKGALAAMLSKD